MCETDFQCWRNGFIVLVFLRRKSVVGFAANENATGVFDLVLVSVVGRQCLDDKHTAYEFVLCVRVGAASDRVASNAIREMFDHLQPALQRYVGVKLERLDDLFRREEFTSTLAQKRFFLSFELDLCLDHWTHNRRLGAFQLHDAYLDLMVGVDDRLAEFPEPRWAHGVNHDIAIDRMAVMPAKYIKTHGLDVRTGSLETDMSFANTWKTLHGVSSFEVFTEQKAPGFIQALLCSLVEKAVLRVEALEDLTCGIQPIFRGTL